MLKLGIKINPKQNALSGFKLFSRDSGSHIPYKTHMIMFPQAITCDCKQYFETTNYSRISHRSLPQRNSNANGRTSIFDVSHDYVKKVVPERKQCFSSKCHIYDMDND